MSRRGPWAYSIQALSPQLRTSYLGAMGRALRPGSTFRSVTQAPGGLVGGRPRDMRTLLHHEPRPRPVAFRLPSADGGAALLGNPLVRAAATALGIGPVVGVLSEAVPVIGSIASSVVGALGDALGSVLDSSVYYTPQEVAANQAALAAGTLPQREFLGIPSRTLEP
jgi:hypothetical protein